MSSSAYDEDEAYSSNSFDINQRQSSWQNRNRRAADEQNNNLTASRTTHHFQTNDYETIEFNQQAEQRQFHSSTPIKSQSSSLRSNYNLTQTQQPANYATNVTNQSGCSLTPTAGANQCCQQLQKQLNVSMSKMALENEELKFELNQTRQDLDRLSEEYEKLRQSLREKEAFQAKMGQRLNTVTEIACILHKRLRDFKCRYYEQHDAWLAQE